MSGTSDPAPISSITARSFSTRTRRRLSRVCWLIAGVLAAWIVVLALTQPQQAQSQHTRLMKAGLAAFLVLAALSVGALQLRGSEYAKVARPVTVSVALTVAWFVFAPGPSTASDARFVAAFALPAAAVSAVSACRPPTDRPGRSAWAGVFFVLAGLGAALLVPLAANAPADTLGYTRLRIAWVGLDLAELAAIVTLALTLHRHLAVASRAAAATGALLLCDAWINVAAAAGAQLWLALALALVEVPLGVGALRVAGRTLHPQEIDAPPR